VARTVVPTGEAEWIWAPGPRQQTFPRAFYAVRDFHVDKVPESAEILVSADEEYILYLNGARLGSNRAATPAEVDRYPVGARLRRGGNRLVAELRSASGAGGLLLALGEPSGDGLRLVSDASWRIFDRHHPGLHRAWLPLEEGSEPAVSMGRPPVGRWRVPELGPSRPAYEDLAGGLLRRAPREPVRVQRGEGGSWLPWKRDGEERTEPLGSWVTFDWGEVVSGYLLLDHRLELLSITGLLFVGEDLPDPRGRQVDSCLVTVPESVTWEDVLPRRFRYVTVLGLEGLEGAALYEVDPGPGAVLLAAAPSSPRVFAVEGPPLRSPVEDDVWRRLRRAR
jgi:hypothetical protein